MQKRLLVFILSLVYSLATKGQQMPVILNFTDVPAMINPAYTGHDGFSEAELLYKKMWVGVPGASESQIFNIHTHVHQYNLGVGFKVTNDINNFLGYTSGSANFSYLIRFNESNSVRFGLSPTLAFHHIYFDRLSAEDPYESAILERAENATLFDFDFGLNIQTGRLNIGVASLQMLNSSTLFKTEQVDNQIYYSHLRHFHLMSTYVIDLPSPYWKLEPGVFAYSPQGLESLLGTSLKAAFKDQFAMSLNYINKVSAGFKVNMLLDGQFKAGYAFEMPTSDLKALSGSSHEIMVGYKFGKHFKESREQQILDELKTLKQENEEQYALISQSMNKDSLDFEKRINERIAQLREEQAQKMEELTSQIKTVGDTTSLNELVMHELERFKEENLKNLNNLANLTIENDSLNESFKYIKEISDLKKESEAQYKIIKDLVQKSDSIRNDIRLYNSAIKDLEGVIRDVQLSLEDSLSPVQLKSGYYEVIGAFKTFKYAKVYQRGVKRLLDINSTIIAKYQEGKEFFVVYASSSPKLAENKEALENYKKRILLYEIHGFEEKQNEGETPSE